MRTPTSLYKNNTDLGSLVQQQGVYKILFKIKGHTSALLIVLVTDIFLGHPRKAISACLGLFSSSLTSAL